MECPHCYGRIALDPKQLGRTWTCPHCRRAFHASRPVSVGRPATGSSRRVARCRSCFHKYFRPAEAEDDRCPACGADQSAYALSLGATVATGGDMAVDARALAVPPDDASPEDQIAYLYSLLALTQRSIFRSGIGNLIAGWLWTLTLIGAIVGIPIAVLGIYKLATHARRAEMSPRVFAASVKKIAIFEFLLGGIGISGLIWGIILLRRARAIRRICDRHGIEA